MKRVSACAVPSHGAEEMHRRLIERGILSDTLRPRREGDRVLFPLKPGLIDPTLTLVEAEFEPRVWRPDSYRDLVNVPLELRALLPGGFDVIGDMVVVRLPAGLQPYQSEVGEALRRFVPGCRVVALDHGVHGESRLRTLEVIAGKGPLTALHTENGISFRVDLSTAYFSPRLSGEHLKVASLSHDGERLLDLFCGIGPFSMAFLVRNPQARAVAVDSNPDAVALLRENAVRLGILGRLECRAEDASNFLRSEEHFDRVVMNLPHEGYKYLGLVGRHVKSPGWLHFYGIVPREKGRRASSDGRIPFLQKGREILSTLSTDGAPGKWSLKEAREVHPYSPTAILVSFTVEKR